MLAWVLSGSSAGGREPLEGGETAPVRGVERVAAEKAIFSALAPYVTSYATLAPYVTLCATLTPYVTSYATLTPSYEPYATLTPCLCLHII